MPDGANVTKKIFKTEPEAALYVDFHQKLGHTTLIKRTKKQITITVVRGKAFPELRSPKKIRGRKL